jgi:hypothetical protein
MKIRAYSPQTGNLLAEDITGINFGNVRQGMHGVMPVLIRPYADVESLSGLALFLQNAGGFSQTKYGYYTNSQFVAGVHSYTATDSSEPAISDHLTETSDPSQFSDGVPLGVNAKGYGDYVWLDVEAGAAETGSTSSINYRFLFEYS